MDDESNTQAFSGAVFFSREELVLSRGRILTELSTFITGHAARGFNSPKNTNSQSPFHSSRDLPVVDHETLRFLFRLFRFDEFTTMEKNTSRVTMIFSGGLANEIDTEYKYTSIGLIRNTVFYISQRIKFFKHFTV